MIQHDSTPMPVDLPGNESSACRMSPFHIVHPYTEDSQAGSSQATFRSRRRNRVSWDLGLQDSKVYVV